MSTSVLPYLVAKSDQLNADDLIGGPISVQITGAKVPGGEQPVWLLISGGHMPWKPCKTMLRLLVAAWGTSDAGRWIGMWMRLYRDPTIASPDGTKNAGGIRVSALSHIDGPRSFVLTERRGKKREWRVDVIHQPAAEGAPTADLDALLADAELTREAVDRWRVANGKGPLASEDAPRFAAWLAANPGRLDEIRALVPEPTTDAVLLADAARERAGTP